MKIVITDPEYFPKESIDVMKDSAEIVAKKFTKDELKNAVKDADALVIRVTTQVDKEIIDVAPRLKVIGSATTGLNHVDVDYAKQKGVEVLSLPGINTVSTAEFAFASILAMAKRIPWAHNHLRSGKWEREKFFGNQLSGKTLGVIGFGRIGRKVGEYGKAFGMKVIFFDPYVDLTTVDMEMRSVGLNELLESSDFISVHAMLTKETENLLSFDQFNKMKKNAMIVNASRGEIVDEKAVLDALKSGKIAAAAIDVWRGYRADEQNELVKYASDHNNLIVTPHIAGSSQEAIDEASVYIANKVVEILGVKK